MEVFRFQATETVSKVVFVHKKWLLLIPLALFCLVPPLQQEPHGILLSVEGICFVLVLPSSAAAASPGDAVLAG